MWIVCCCEWVTLTDLVTPKATDLTSVLNKYKVILITQSSVPLSFQLAWQNNLVSLFCFVLLLHLENYFWCFVAPGALLYYHAGPTWSVQRWPYVICAAFPWQMASCQYLSPHQSNGHLIYSPTQHWNFVAKNESDYHIETRGVGYKVRVLWQHCRHIVW